MIDIQNVRNARADIQLAEEELSAYVNCDKIQLRINNAIFRLRDALENLTKHNGSSKKDCFNPDCAVKKDIFHVKCPKTNCEHRISSPS